jgi:hypothetical protein
MDGAGLEAEQVKKIKHAAENNYKARRRGLISNFTETYTGTAGSNTFDGSTKEWRDPDAAQLMIRDGDKSPEYPGSFSTSSSDSASLTLRQTSEYETGGTFFTSLGNPAKAPYSTEYVSQGINAWQSASPQTMDSIWWHGGLANTYNIRNKQELALLMHYLENVFSLQFGFYRPSTSDTGSTWYPNTLLRSKYLYHATLSISATHQALLRNGTLCGPLTFSGDADQSYTLTLRELQRQIDSLPNLTGAELLKARFEVLGSMNQVLSLEVSQRQCLPDLIPKLTAMLLI